MTGFGQAQEKAAGYDISVELKSVNHRFLDINIRIPRKYMLLEEKVRDFIKKNASRGRFEINILINMEQEAPRTIKVDKELAIAYYSALKELAEILSISANFRVYEFSRLPELLQIESLEENTDIIWNQLELVLTSAMQDLQLMRIKEGKNLAVDIKKRNSYLLQKVAELEIRSPQVVEAYTERLQNRLQEALGQELIDQDRIIQEAAIFADKVSVTEEIVRLKSHIKQFNELIEYGDTIGRKSDFLLQEMNREINTVASKANDSEMSIIVVDVKAELEKIREQIQNIE